MTLSRLTTDYIAREDRLRICGCDAEGLSQMLWLTRRLADQMLAALIRMIDGIPPQTSSDKAASASGVNSLNDTVVKSAQHEVARARLVPAPPVTPPPQAAGWLVTRIDLTPRSGGVVVTFRGEAGETAMLEVATIHLHQWLGIIYNNYSRAQWQSDIWPTWLIEAEQPRRPVDSVLH